MEFVDILFVGIGLLCVAASFFLPEKLAGGRQKEEQRTADLKDAVLAELHKKENLDRIVTDVLSELSGRMREQKNELLLDSEAELDRMSNEKMLSFGEYSDEVLEKINQNHMEVVFLYDMLKEKESSLKDFAARLEGTNQQIEALLQDAAEEDARLDQIYQQVETLARQAESAVSRYEETRRKQEIQAEARRIAQAREQAQQPRRKRKQAEEPSERAGNLEQEQAEKSQPGGQAASQADRNWIDDLSGGEKNSIYTSQMTTQELETLGIVAEEGMPFGTAEATGQAAAAKTGSSRRTQSQPSGREKTGRRESGSGSGTAEQGRAAVGKAPARKRTRVQVQPSSPVAGEGVFGLPAEESGESMLTEERNERILRMYRGGMSILEISRAMGLGQGEVKLVVDLFHRAR